MSATLTQAGRSAAFEAALDRIDPDLCRFLRLHGLHELAVLGYMFGTDTDAAILIKIRGVLEALSAANPSDRWPGQLLLLTRVAQDEAVSAADRLGRVSELDIACDHAHSHRVASHSAEALDLAKLAVPGLTLLPTAWKGKRYRRREAASNEQERAQTYLRERAQEGKRVMSLIMEAHLPFAATLGRARGEDHAASQRCCMGLAPKSLRQRLACWAPVRRYLLEVYQHPFPAKAEEFLDYLAHLRRSGAAKTACKSAQLSLSFLEEAGEVAEADRLATQTSVLNLVKEAKLAAEVALTTRLEGESWRANTADQAPQLPLRLLLAFEQVVADLGRPVYQRAFAWYRLLRHWASLRWDDTQGINPESLDRRARGLFAALEKSKTSGPGKKLKILPVYVSDHAYLAFPWLDTGLALWRSDAMAFKRDYLLPLPAEDLQSARRTQALYSDSAGFSRSLLASLKDSDGQALLLPEACSFWSEHSDRAGLDSWCAALSIEESERNFLGRWAAKGSAGVYVRTACRVVENLQKISARHAQASLCQGPDFFGEEGLLRDLATHLRLKGVAQDRLNDQVRRLSLCDFQLDVTPLGPVTSEARFLRNADPLQAESDVDDGAAAGDEAPDGDADSGSEDGAEKDTTEAPSGHPLSFAPSSPGEAPVSTFADLGALHGSVPVTPVTEDGGSSSAADSDVLAVAGALAAEPDEMPAGFIVSISKQGLHRCLHFFGSCFRVPGVHYKEFRVIGAIMPSDYDIDSRCTDCFPGDGLVVRKLGKFEQSEEESFSTSSSSSSSLPEAKKACPSP